MRKFLKPSLLSAALALTLAFGAAPLTSHAAEAVPASQTAEAVSAVQSVDAAPISAVVPAADASAASVPSATVSLQGKKVSILGDSISTFTGTMPADYNIYYPESGDIPNARQTWWGQLLANTGMVLCRNASSANTDVTGNSLALDGSAPGCSIRRIVDLKEIGRAHV